MLAPCRGFVDKAGGLKGAFDEGVTAGDAMMLPEFFMEVGDVKAAIGGAVEIQDPLKLLERDAFGTRSFHAPVKDAVVALRLIPGFPAFHGSVRDPDNISGLSPEDLFRSGL